MSDDHHEADSDWAAAYPLFAFGITGPAWQLEELAPHLKIGVARLRKAPDGGAWELVSLRFRELGDYNEARSRAGEWIKALNGLAALRIDEPAPMQLGAGRRYTKPGSWDQWVHPEPATMKLRAFAPTVLVNGIAPEAADWAPLIRLLWLAA